MTDSIRQVERGLHYVRERQSAVSDLVAAIVKEVILAQGENPGTDAVYRFIKDHPEMRTQIANRILSWVNHRLGLVDGLLLADLATAARQQAIDEGRLVTMGDIALHRARQIRDLLPPRVTL